MLDDPLVPVPDVGRVFRTGRRVRLGDASRSHRLRLDAIARYGQDVGNDDTADSGLDAVAGPAGGVWVVRRSVVDLYSPPRWYDWIELTTWCGGIGALYAERRIDITGEDGARIELASLWVNIDSETQLPAKPPEIFRELYAEAAVGRRITARLWLKPPSEELLDGGAERREWVVRATDFDVIGHVNNATYWAAVEEVLASHRDHPAHPSHGGPVRAVLEFGSGIDPGQKVELVVHTDGDDLDIWFLGDGVVEASARLFPLSR